MELCSWNKLPALKYHFHAIYILLSTADYLGMQDDMEKDAKARKTARKHYCIIKFEGNIPRKFTYQMKAPVCIYEVHPHDLYKCFLLAGSSCPVHSVSYIIVP